MENSEIKITLPTVHTNGTGAQTLMDDYLKLRTALQEALDVMQQVEFHARDYYPQGAEAVAQSRREWHKIRADLQAAEQHCLAVALHVQTFIK